jgi:thiamine pyrophosphate-dependent acetolactate synthase large subunit-like protein
MMILVYTDCMSKIQLPEEEKVNIGMMHFSKQISEVLSLKQHRIVIQTGCRFKSCTNENNFSHC